MNLRKATLMDVELLKHWDEQPHVKACDPTGDWDWEIQLNRTADWQELLIAEVEGRPIGMLQIIDPHLEESHYWGEVGSGKRAIDIWIGEARNLNKGYGTQMMKMAIERCFANSQVHEIFIDPLTTNTKAHRFYERLGFQFLEERDFEGDSCYVYHLPKHNFTATN